ncbi:hypothetical protein D3C85_1556050 [compost metagenome]
MVSGLIEKCADQLTRAGNLPVRWWLGADLIIRSKRIIQAASDCREKFTSLSLVQRPFIQVAILPGKIGS